MADQNWGKVSAAAAVAGVIVAAAGLFIGAKSTVIQNILGGSGSAPTVTVTRIVTSAGALAEPSPATPSDSVSGGTAGKGEVIFADQPVTIPGGSCASNTEVDLDGTAASQDIPGLHPVIYTGIEFAGPVNDLELTSCPSEPEHFNILPNTQASEAATPTFDAVKCNQAIQTSPAAGSIEPRSDDVICANTNLGDIALVVISKVQTSPSYAIYANVTLWKWTS